jgi:hypothetical protein|tara:strand:- start:35 stop:205 length:171 start_codon:yes stop_codon:yes gene_type:complete
LFISSILKNTIKVLVTNPEIRKKAVEVTMKAYKNAKPKLKEISKAIKTTINDGLKK